MKELAPAGYAELHMASAFSFLEGASPPEDLAQAAAAQGLSAAALCDRDGLYGAPRWHKAAKAAGVRPLLGAELTLEEPGRQRLTVLVESRTGYNNLCRLLTAAARGRPKGAPAAGWELLHEFSGGLQALTRDPCDRLRDIFAGRLHVDLQRHRLREQEAENRRLLTLGLPVLCTNGVRYATPRHKPLLDALTCIRLKSTLDQAGRRLEPNRERHLRSAAEMRKLFADLPHAYENAVRLGSRLEFTLDSLGYRFPDYPLPPGETPDSYLTKLTFERAPDRFRPYTPKVRAQLEHELAVIAKLSLAGYFLILWDIIAFCRRENILVQGRGSAANSAVCFALGITAVDPVKMELLFERFLSEERGEWPDIDLDLPSGAQREKVIQYLYARYGAGVAMTANVITYRPKLAIRESAKVMGYNAEQVERLSKAFSALEGPELKDGKTPFAAAAQGGFDPNEPRLKKTLALMLGLLHLPRHLGQHSGGMVLAQGRLDALVPLEPASMPGRVVVQWDKEDCADMGLIKVDLLGLGMMAVFEDAIPMIARHEGAHVDLAQLPHDEKVYELIRAADTVGTFQLESRAQMSSLVRHLPERFYDLVVQVAIIRPGPIVGGMVNPFFRRRRGEEPVTYPHPCLEPVLRRTLGIPLFQEQVIRMAMVAADFSGGEAEELRRAMGFKRSVERMEDVERRLQAGMKRKGLDGKTRALVSKLITSFALYGFPESHAASFALLAYASCWLKVHHPAAFYASLLNAWPMGFYHPATLIKDAQRRGVEVLPVDAQRSGWLCRWERGGVRLGLRYVKSLREQAGRRVEAAAASGPFLDPRDLARRAGLSAEELDLLASAGALACFGLQRREALWQAAKAGRPEGPLFESAYHADASPLREMSPRELTAADYRATEVTTGPHILAHHRAQLTRRGILAARDLASLRSGQTVRIAGSVIVRQRPPTAKGFCFVTLEDETGLVQAIIKPQLFLDERHIVLSPAMIVEGVLQASPGSYSVRATRLLPLHDAESARSHDFH
jgi:error-prone DNA polymerase